MVRLSLSDIIMSGVFERYPLLKIVVAEFELGWAPHFLWMLDYDYVERKQLTPYRFKGDARPSDIFRSNVYLSFQEDALGIQCRNILARIHRRTGMDGVRTAEGGEGVTGAMIRARIWVDGRLAGGLQAPFGGTDGGPTVAVESEMAG